MQEQRSILDFVKGSVDRLETKIGQGDRRKLTEYLEAIRDIERRIQKAEEQNATIQDPGDRSSGLRAGRVRRSTPG